MRLLILLLFINSHFCYSQHSDSITYFKVNNLEGVIFNKEGLVLPIEYFHNRNILSICFVMKLDSLLFVQLTDSLKVLSNSCSLCPDIIDNWYQYYRQYVAYKDGDDGKLYVDINFVWKDWEMKFPSWRTKWVEILGANTFVWEITYDCKEKRFQNLIIN